MGIKTVPHPPYSPELAPCDFWLFPKLRGCSYETIEEMKESVTKVIDMLTQEDFHGALQKLLEMYKCIAVGGDYFKGDYSFMCVLSIKVPIRKKSGNLLYAPRIYLSIVGGRIAGFIIFLRILMLCEMQIASFRIWTWVPYLFNKMVTVILQALLVELDWDKITTMR